MKKYAPFLILLLGLPLFVFAQDVDFVPLTNIPALYETGNAFSLESFLNNLYRIAIGIAAIVAVLQIMRAGIMYMGGDSVTEKKEAKDLIALAIGGLILVLSPVVVFSVINPEILSLRIGNLEKLKTEAPSTITNQPPDTSCTYNKVQAKVLSQGQTCSQGAGPNDIWLVLTGNERTLCCAGITENATCCAQL